MYKSAEKCAYHLLISKSLFKKLITPAMFECKTRLIAHSKALKKLVIMMKFHRFKRICFCVNRKKLFCVGVKFFSNFFFQKRARYHLKVIYTNFQPNQLCVPISSWSPYSGGLPLSFGLGLLKLL